MSKPTLFMAPGTCARVTAICLNELHLDFDFELIRFMKGQHKSTEYLALNPLGKVPALRFEDHTLTENVAIIQFLNNRFGKILPATDDEFEKSALLADLCFCSSTLHPIVTRIRIPHMFSEPEHAKIVKAKACASMDPYFKHIEQTLDAKEWWYGDTWSAMDAYIFWVFWRVEGAEYDVSRFPNFVAHARRMEARDSVKKAIALENEAQAILESEGLAWVPPKAD